MLAVPIAPTTCTAPPAPPVRFTPAKGYVTESEQLHGAPVDRPFAALGACRLDRGAGDHRRAGDLEPSTGAPDLEFGFLLHDIGKVAIPDAILYKPSTLTEEERALMAQHPMIGASIVGGIEFLTHASQIVRSHHERWDGGGYPDGMAGEEIPLASRVFTIADVLDALTTDRPYRPASPFGVAREMIVASAGTQFDPRVVEAFKSIDDASFERIAAEIR